MPENYTIQEVVRNIQTLTIRVDEGFKGVHLRQDEANGKLQDNTVWIEQNKEFIKDLKIERRNNYKRLIDLAWKIGATLMLSGVGLKWILQVLSKM